MSSLVMRTARNFCSAAMLIAACVSTFLTYSAFAQVASDDAENQQLISEICHGNVDCLNYYQNKQYLTALLGYRDPWVAVKGKKKSYRALTMDGAHSYILNHHLMEGASVWRYLSIVSQALGGEAGNKTTIFSSENIIETFYAFQGTPNDTTVAPGVQQVCDALNEYYQRFNSKSEADRVDQHILQKKEKSAKLVAPNVWHEVLIEWAKKAVPNGNPEATVADWQSKYCLFAASCPASANSPFGGSSPTP